jgi:hypothetical protein
MSARHSSRTTKSAWVYVLPPSVSWVVYGTDARHQVALKSRGIDKLLEEAREDNKENDAVYLGRKCKSRPPRLLLTEVVGDRY